MKPLAIALLAGIGCLASSGTINNNSSADLAQLMRQCPFLHGFYGASSIERIPVEEQVKKTVGQYKALRLNRM